MYNLFGYLQLPSWMFNVNIIPNSVSDVKQYFAKIVFRSGWKNLKDALIDARTPNFNNPINNINRNYPHINSIVRTGLKIKHYQ